MSYGEHPALAEEVRVNVILGYDHGQSFTRSGILLHRKHGASRSLIRLREVVRVRAVVSVRNRILIVTGVVSGIGTITSTSSYYRVVLNGIRSGLRFFPRM